MYFILWEVSLIDRKEDNEKYREQLEDRCRKPESATLLEGLIPKLDQWKLDIDKYTSIGKALGNEQIERAIGRTHSGIKDIEPWVIAWRMSKPDILDVPWELYWFIYSTATRNADEAIDPSRRFQNT